MADAKPRVPRIYQTSGAPSFWALMNGPARTHAADAGDVADLTGHVAASVRSSGCTWTPGPFGNRLLLNGASNGAKATGLAPQTGSFAVTYRFNAASYGTNACMINYGINWDVIFNNGVFFRILGLGGVITNTTPALNAEHFVAAYYDAIAGQVGISLDGGAFAVATTTAPRVFAGSLFFGNNSGGSLPFTGAIDDVRIFNRVPSAAEFASIYADPYWRLRPPRSVAVWGGNPALIFRRGLYNRTGSRGVA